jgi:hypothetical protein
MLKRMSQKESKGRGKKSKMKDSMSGAGRRNKPIHNTRPPPAGTFSLRQPCAESLPLRKIKSSLNTSASTAPATGRPAPINYEVGRVFKLGRN